MKQGKYEAVTPKAAAKAKAKKSNLLSAYFTSLICLVLCAAMFLSTTMAWFTSEVENTGNEIYIGTLDVDLLLGETSLEDHPDTKVFDDSIKWEPGYTALRTLTIKNEGDLAFKFTLGFIAENDKCTSAEGTALSQEEILELAEYFGVYVKEGTYTVPTEGTPSFETEITEDKGWTHLGTLAGVLAGDIKVYSDAVEKKDETKTFSVALHMAESAPNEIMGQKLSLNVKLIAYQKTYESDVFGDQYDQGATKYVLPALDNVVTVTPENIAATDFNQDNTHYEFVGDFTEAAYTFTVNETAHGYTQTFDASNAAFPNATNVKFHFGIADGLSTIAENGEFKAREGLKIVYGFNLGKGSLSIGGKSTQLVIASNTVKAMDADASNCEILVVDNVVDCDGTYKRFDGGVSNDKSFYLSATNYALTMKNNVLKCSVKDTISINGRGEWDMADFVNNQDDDSIDESKINNSIKLEGNSISAKRKALYIWGDHTYGCNHVLTEGSSVDKLPTVSKYLIKSLIANNTVITEQVLVGFGQLDLTEEQASAIS